MEKQVGKYELGKTLGMGVRSKVKVARNTETGELFAVKIVKKELIITGQNEEHLKHTAALLKAINHPNVVGVHEVMHSKRHIYLIMDLEYGEVLYDKVAAVSCFDEDTARTYFRQLIYGLQHCHSRGIVHGDIKPENLLVSTKGELKISFVGAAILDSARPPSPSVAAEAQSHVAPEIAQGAHYDPLIAEVWFCGVMLFVMLTGRLPFDHPNLFTLYDMKERGEYKIPRYLSDSAQDLIAKMIYASTSRRITIDGIVAHPWFRVGP